MSGQWFGQWQGATAGDWWGAGETPTPAEQTFTSSGSWNPRWYETYGGGWVVRVKGKKKKFKTAAAALKAAAKTETPVVEYAGVDLGREFARIIETYRSESMSRRISADIAEALARIERTAIRRAQERDDEEAILLLLH